MSNENDHIYDMNAFSHYVLIHPFYIPFSIRLIEKYGDIIAVSIQNNLKHQSKPYRYCLTWTQLKPSQCKPHSFIHLCAAIDCHKKMAKCAQHNVKYFTVELTLMSAEIAMEYDEFIEIKGHFKCTAASFCIRGLIVS